MSETAIDFGSVFRGDNKHLAAAILEVTEEMRDYWPLTVRQVYYQLVSRLILENRYSQYKRVSEVGTKLRRRGYLDWEAIEDRSRRTIEKRGMTNVQAYVAEQIESAFDPRYYTRCYVQNQKCYVEVTTEKDALSKIIEDAVYIFCTRVVITKGQLSATIVNEMAQRFEQAAFNGQKPILMHCGDFDPSGICIPNAIVRNLKDSHGIDVELIRIALNPEQVAEYALPESFEAAKKTDPNYQRFIDIYGDASPVELDALHPEDLTEIINSELVRVLDMSAVAEEHAIEAEERKKLKRFKQDLIAMGRREHADLFPISTSADNEIRGEY